MIISNEYRNIIMIYTMHCKLGIISSFGLNLNRKVKCNENNFYRRGIMRKLKFSRIFRNFLISYVIILLIPLIAAFISYHTSIKIAESKSIESSLLVLNQSKTHLEQRFSEVEKFSRQLARNSYINAVLSEKQQGDVGSVYQSREISRELLNNIQANDFLEDS